MRKIVVIGIILSLILPSTLPADKAPFAMTKPAINMRAIRIATSFFIETPP